MNLICSACGALADDLQFGFSILNADAKFDLVVSFLLHRGDTLPHLFGELLKAQSIDGFATILACCDVLLIKSL